MIFCLTIPFKISNVLAQSRYARIENATNIYKTTNESNNISNVICIAEKTYFVEIIGDYDVFYRVNYNSINGYVKKTDVKEISTTPHTPYPYNIQIVIGSNCNLRSSPTTKSSTNNILSTIYSNEQNLIFVGRIFSEEAIDFGGNTWYYVKYQDKYGYVYNKYVKSITPIYPNTEEISYIQSNTERIKNPITHTPSIIIIVILMIPLFATLIILYLPLKQKRKPKPRKSPKIFDKY